MHVMKASYQGNPNVGLFAWANDKLCLVGAGFKKHDLHDMAEILKVPIHQVSVCNTDLIGVFCAGNNRCLILPSLVTESEELHIKKICSEAGMQCIVVSTLLTALGNNILCNDQGVLVNPEFSARVKKEIRQGLGVRLNPGTIALHEITGSLCVIRKDKALVCSRILDTEEAKLKELLGVECTHATLNFGSQNLRSAIILNNNGFIVGDMSTGVEITTADEVLGFLNQ